MSQIIVEDHPSEELYAIDVDGTRAGFAAYKDVSGTTGPERIFYHTVIGEEFGGQGLAGKLAKTALDATIAAGFTIVAVCPFIKGWIEKHPEYEASTTPVTPEHLAQLP